MSTTFARLQTPDARRIEARRRTLHDEVKGLVALIRQQCISDEGVKPSRTQVAELLGVSLNTLDNYARKPSTDRYGAPRGVPYTVVYALEAMAACPDGVKLSLWGAVE